MTRPSSAAGIDIPALPGNASISLKLEAVKKAMQQRSDTPPPSQQAAPVRP
jgi:hypothetical protein